MNSSATPKDACRASFVKAFALEWRQKLMAGLVSQWTRRSRNLLEIGCGGGFFTHFLWESGFDVTAVDHKEKELKAARSRMGPRVDFHLTALDHLPFEDNSFDYAAVPTILDLHENPAGVMAEAARVAAKGIIVVFSNKLSLYCLTCRGKDADCRLSFFSARKMAREICPECRITMRGILPGPMFIWRENRLCSLINSLGSRLPIGAYIGMRLDFGSPRGVTPLSLRIKQACMKPAKPAAIFEQTNNLEP